jgi:MFS transporter, DHA2 family, multidrug resistance protein
MVALLAIAGIASGTFYSLTLTFVLTALPKRLIIFGIAAYAADIVFISNFASAIEGWYIDHLSWRWIFWNAALFTPLMMLCVYFGRPRRAQGPTGEDSLISAWDSAFYMPRWIRESGWTG